MGIFATHEEMVPFLTGANLDHAGELAGLNGANFLLQAEIVIFIIWHTFVKNCSQNTKHTTGWTKTC